MLNGKVALVTGASKGIGREIALYLAEHGARIVICGQNEQRLSETADQIRAKGTEALAVAVNVSNSDDVKNMVRKALDKFGGIHILVNNAGITRDGLAVKMSEENWDAVLDVNLKGAFLCIKHVAKTMMKQRAGKIINISSVIGLIGNAGQANYSASKGGVIALTKTMAKELAPRNINVNAIAPGFIQTDMTDELQEDAKNAMLEQIPIGRFGQAKEVAKLVLFLSGEDSEYITGQTITIDGGLVMQG